MSEARLREFEHLERLSRETTSEELSREAVSRGYLRGAPREAVSRGYLRDLSREATSEERLRILSQMSGTPRAADAHSRERQGEGDTGTLLTRNPGHYLSHTL